jgi:anti-anti-sigma factor
MTKKKGHEHFHLLDQDDVSIVEVVGDPGSLAEEALRHELRPMLARIELRAPPRVVIDFQQCEYFGSALLEEILRIGHTVQEKNGIMALCNLSVTGRDLITVVHFERLWPVFTGREEAVAYVRRAPISHHDDG